MTPGRPAGWRVTGRLAVTKETGTLTPTEAIEDVAGVGNHIEDHLQAIRNESNAVAAQWDALGRIGGHRDDHAAALLANLLPDLKRLLSFTRSVVEKIEKLEADPFGRKTKES